MNLSNFEQLLQKGFKQFNIPINSKQIKLFITYLKEIQNLPYNLTSIKKPRDIIIEHFFDSLALLNLKPEILINKKVIDVGCGAGFPLLPLKIIAPNFEAYFLDQKQKSINFVRTVVEKLKIHQCFFLNYNSKSLKQEYQNFYDILVSRAVGSIEYMVKNSFHLLKPNGLMVLYKGPKYTKEIQNIPTSIKRKIKNIQTYPVTIPFLHKERFLLFVYKN